MFKVEAVVGGAGVVGLAIARALALRGVQVLLLEKEGVVGSGTSSRNSEVIHAGLYYEPESLKAQLCVRLGAGHRPQHRIFHRASSLKSYMYLRTTRPAISRVGNGGQHGTIRIHRSQLHFQKPPINCARKLSPAHQIDDLIGTEYAGRRVCHLSELALLYHASRPWRRYCYGMGYGRQILRASVVAAHKQKACSPHGCTEGSEVASSGPQLLTWDKELIECAAQALFEFVFSRTTRFNSKCLWASCDEATKEGFRKEAAAVMRAVWPLQSRAKF